MMQRRIGCCGEPFWNVIAGAVRDVALGPAWIFIILSRAAEAVLTTSET